MRKGGTMRSRNLEQVVRPVYRSPKGTRKKGRRPVLHSSRSQTGPFSAHNLAGQGRWLVCAAFLFGIALAKESMRSPAQFAQEARTPVHSLAKTEYQHKTEIDEAERTYFCDCSGFLGFLLKKKFPIAYESLEGDEAPWRSRPLAVTFHETFI